MEEKTDTLTQILDIAQRIMHTRGYHSFSYATISQEVGIKKASIHYYFPNKTDLVQAIIVRHRQTFQTELAAIDHETNDVKHKLELYVDHYANAVRDKDQMCMCGILAADFPVLPEVVRREVHGFFADNTAWLTRIFAQGQAAGVLNVAAPSIDEAELLISGIEGAMLVARSLGDAGQFRRIIQRLLDRYTVA